MKAHLRTADLKTITSCAFLLLLCLSAAGCGSKVSGHTYQEGFISISFQSGGKATFASGPIGTDCTYKESGKKITLTCTDQTMELTLDGDGNLNGPSELGKLTKVK